MQKSISWVTSKGQKVDVSIRLVANKQSDGDKIDISCREMEIMASVAGLGIVGSGTPWIRSEIPNGIVATIGRLAISRENLARINQAIAEIAETPEWQAKLAWIAKSEKEGQEYDAHRARMRKVMGY